jgi:hypothetical protein
VDSQLLGHIGKIKFSDHDVADERKYLDLAPKLFSEKIVMNPFGGTITKPCMWAARTGQNRNPRIAEDTTLWQRPICDAMFQTIVSSYTWMGCMAG